MDDEVKAQLQKLQAFEREQAESLLPTIDTVQNSLIQVVLNKIRLDSMKHAQMLQAIMDLETGQVIWQVDKDVMVRMFTQHLDIEKKMLSHIRGLIDTVGDESTKPLFQEILADEMVHHRMLSRLVQLVEDTDIQVDGWMEVYSRTLLGEVIAQRDAGDLYDG